MSKAGAEGALEGQDIYSAFRYMLSDFHRRSIQNIDAWNYVNSKLILLGTGKLISESCVYWKQSWKYIFFQSSKKYDTSDTTFNKCSDKYDELWS